MENQEEPMSDETAEYFNPDAVAHARSKIPDEDTMTALSDFFKNFGDSTRIKIVSALMAGELCVADIAEVLEISASAIWTPPTNNVSKRQNLPMRITLL